MKRRQRFYYFGFLNFVSSYLFVYFCINIRCECKRRVQNNSEVIEKKSILISFTILIKSCVTKTKSRLFLHKQLCSYIPTLLHKYIELGTIFHNEETI